MAEKKSKISKLFDKYLAKMNSIKREKHASQLYHELTRGKTSYTSPTFSGICSKRSMVQYPGFEKPDLLDLKPPLT